MSYRVLNTKIGALKTRACMSYGPDAQEIKYSTQYPSRKIMEEMVVFAETGTLSGKIISIAAGEAHTLALAGDGSVYSWGRGTFGRLGTGTEDDQDCPVRVKFYGTDVEKEEKLKIVGIAAGAYHSLALADDGSVWGWGYNTYGQINATGKNYLEPHLLEGFSGLGSPGSSMKGFETDSGKHIKISSVKAGGMMSLAIDSFGELWMWGNYPHPPEKKSPEGEVSLVNFAALIRVPNFHGHTVVKVACGNEHVVALVCSGETNDVICYSWGRNNHGQLGLGDNESRLHPEMIEPFKPESQWEAYEIACGASHTAILAKRKKPNICSESFCWTVGLGDNGQLGHGTTQTSLSPKLVNELPHNILLLSVDCGLFHTSVVSSAGEVWSWGMEKGLGLCPDARFTGSDSGDAISPVLIPRNGIHDTRFRECTQISCGAAHTVLLSDAGFKLWSWGRGRNGVLGNGKTVDCYAPATVLWPPLEELSNAEEKNTEENSEMEKKLCAAIKEMTVLQTKLLLMEKYATILHGSIFGKPFHDNEIPLSLENSGTFDVGKEWENMLESSDSRKLIRLEMFYKDMLSGVKHKLMKKMIQETVEDYLKSAAARTSG